MEVTQELVDDAIDLLSHETMPELDLDELLLSIGMNIVDIQAVLSHMAPENRPVTKDVTPRGPPGEYLSDEKLRRLRHMR